MPNIKMPDGKVVSFPDSMPKEEIRSLISKKFPNEAARLKGKSQTGSFDTAITQGFQGIPFIGTFSDEAGDAINARARSLLSDRTYDDIYKENRVFSQAKINQQQDDRPILSFGSQMAGGLGPLGVISKVGKVAGLANKLRNTSALGKIGTGLGLGATSGFAYGTGAAEGDLSERAKEGVAPALFGGALGGAIPASALAAGKIKNAVTPTIDQAKKPIVELSEKYNVPLGIDDLSDSKFYKTVISEGENIPMSGAGKFKDQQAKAFNRALVRTIGEDGEAFTPALVEDAYKNIGKQFDDALAGRKIELNDRFRSEIDNILLDAEDNIAQDYFRVVKRNVDKVLSDTGLNQVSGEKLASVRSSLTKSLRKNRNEATPYLSEILETIDEQLLINMSGKASSKLRDARLKYKNLKTLEPLIAKAVSEGGEIRPALLKNRVIKNFGAKNVATGKAGELGDLVQIADNIKDTVPNSGTSQRTLARNVLTGNIGTAPFFSMVNPAIGGLQIGASGTGLLANRALQKGNYNQAYLKSILEANKLLPPSKANITPTLLGGQTSGYINQ